MTDHLASAREKLAEHVAPYLDRKALGAAGVEASDIFQTATSAVVSELSRHFVLTPRAPLLAVIHERGAEQSNIDALTNRVVMLELALATSRIR